MPASTDELVRAYRAGSGAPTVARRYGVSKHAVYRALEATGVPVRPREDYALRARRDLRGESFGRLTAKTRVPDTDRSKWRCLCECGRRVDVWQDNLLSGRSRSCGSCLQT